MLKAGSNKLGGAVDSLDWTEALQQDLARLARCAITNHMKFNTNKSLVLHPERCDPGRIYRLGDRRLERSPAERDLGILADGELLKPVSV